MLDLIKTVFEAEGWTYSEKDGIVRMDINGQETSWTSFLKQEDEDSFSYYSVLPVKAGENRIGLCMELIQMINFTLKVGSFEINLSKEEGASRGQIMFKTYGLLNEDMAAENEEIAKGIIQRVVAYNMLTMDVYAQIIMKAIYGESDRTEDYLK